MTALRTMFEWTIFKIGMVAIAATMLVFPAASSEAQTARAADGISTQTLASVTAVEPGGHLVVMRMVLEPGVALPAHHHPGSASFTVVEGALQTTLVRGGAAVNRNGIELVAEIGATMNLTAGQSISYAPHAVKTVANRTGERLVLMATILLDADESMVAYDDWSPLFQPDLH
jgi:mannose-6-phosphate isomerase-like protein (cupin superfamily)